MQAENRPAKQRQSVPRNKAKVYNVEPYARLAASLKSALGGGESLANRAANVAVLSSSVRLVGLPMAWGTFADV